MTAWLLAVGRMLGLGSIAGIRPSLTLAVIGVVGYFDWGVETNSAFSWLNHWLAIGIFVIPLAGLAAAAWGLAILQLAAIPSAILALRRVS